jgi:hypothetical protein
MNKNDIYKIARSQVKPQKVVSYNPETDKALLLCGHERYAPRHGIAPKKLLCAQCISIKIEAVEQPRALDATTGGVEKALGDLWHHLLPNEY